MGGHRDVHGRHVGAPGLAAALLHRRPRPDVEEAVVEPEAQVGRAARLRGGLPRAQRRDAAHGPLRLEPALLRVQDGDDAPHRRLVVGGHRDVHGRHVGALRGARLRGRVARHLLPAVRLAVPRGAAPPGLQEPQDGAHGRLLLGQRVPGLLVLVVDQQAQHAPLGAQRARDRRGRAERRPRHRHDALPRVVAPQNIMYFPLLALARVVWLQQSVAYVLNLDETAGRGVKGAPGELKPVPHEKLELAGLALHYVWYFAIASLLPNWREVLVYVLVSNVSCGLSLALVFGLGHNGMAVYDARNRPDYWKLQVTTTRNISHDRFGLVHWFCGGLDYQVEHHLFPTVPRHHLKKVNELTMAFCAARGVTYHEAGLIAGTVEVLKHLKDIAEEFVSEFPAM